MINVLAHEATPRDKFLFATVLHIKFPGHKPFKEFFEIVKKEVSPFFLLLLCIKPFVFDFLLFHAETTVSITCFLFQVWQTDVSGSFPFGLI